MVTDRTGKVQTESVIIAKIKLILKAIYWRRYLHFTHYDPENISNRMLLVHSDC